MQNINETLHATNWITEAKRRKVEQQLFEEIWSANIVKSWCKIKLEDETITMLRLKIISETEVDKASLENVIAPLTIVTQCDCSPKTVW